MAAIDKTTSEKIGIILLAGGVSSRLGEPKQLLPYHGTTLLQHSLQAALDCSAGPVIVVLGARFESIKNEIESTVAQVVINTEWQEGMALSLRCGLEKLIEVLPEAEAAIIMVCDQPFVSATLLNKIITAYQKTGKPIVACSYGDTYGPPVLFHQTFFPRLMQLKGDIGARGVVRQHVTEAELIPFPQGAIDVDTPADYQKLQ